MDPIHHHPLPHHTGQTTNASDLSLTIQEENSRNRLLQLQLALAKTTDATQKEELKYLLSAEEEHLLAIQKKRKLSYLIAIIMIAIFLFFFSRIFLPLFFPFR